MRTSISRLLLAGIVLISAVNLVAQTESGAAHAPDGGIRQHVEGISVPAIPGAAFIAKEEVQLQNHLQDGTVIATTYFAMIVRDTQGRVYRERRDRVPMGSSREPRLTQTEVSDPKAGTRTTCILATQTCTVIRWHPNLHFAAEPVGASRDGLSYLTRENLGNSTADGLEVIETQETRTFSAGTFGNDRPVAVTKQYWYSPQLQINVAVNRHDPRTEDQKLNLTELNTSEPDPAWFTPREGFRIVRERGN